MYINEVRFAGNLGNLEFKIIGDKKVAKFSVACNKSYEKDGQKITETEWANCEAWGWVADVLKDAKKGDNVYVDGPMKTDKWEKDGQKFERVKIKAFRVLVAPKRENKDQVEQLKTLDEAPVDIPF